MAQTKIGDPHGLYRVFVGLVDSAGYNYGTSGSGVAASTTMYPYQMNYAQSAEFAQPTRSTIDFTGGDVWTGSFVYGIISLGSFDITSSTIEADLIALTSGSNVEQTLNSLQTIFTENIFRPTPPQVWIMTVFRIQSKETGSIGANKYITMVFPRSWVAPKGVAGAPNFQAQGTYGFSVTPTSGDRMPWGPLFCSTTLGLALDQTPNFYVITDNPVHTIGYKPAAAATSVTITLPYLPVDADYTVPDSATQPIQVYINGTQVDATSINKTTGAIVIDAPSTEFDGTEYIGIFYETEYETVGNNC